MNEQIKVSFTKGKGNTYISEEVDGYLAMLHSAYEEMEKELEDLENKSASEKEQLNAEQERLRKLLEEERKERFKAEMKNAGEIEEFYEEKVAELEELLSSIRKGSDELKKKNEIEAEAKAQSEADEILEQVQMKRQEMLDKTQEEVISAKRQEFEKEMEDMEGKNQRKASIISDIIFYVTLVLMVMFAFLFSQGAMGNGTLGGFRIYEVLTTSMESVYPRGSLIVVKQTAPSELVAGDDIAFIAKGNKLVTHRIIEIIDNHEASGNRAFITKGVDNAVADADIVLAENVVGKVIKGIPRLGAIIRWSGENLWVIVLFFLSLMAFSFFLKMFWRNSKKIRDFDK